MAFPLSELQKEKAVVGYLVRQGFQGIPQRARPLPDAFKDTLAAIAYAAALELDHQRKAVTVHSIQECVEKNREWIRLANAEAKERGFVNWTQIFSEDDSLAFQTGQAAAECLAAISEAAGRRKATEIYDKGKAGEISLAEAMEALGGIKKAVEGQPSWESDLIDAEELCDDKNADAYKDSPVIIEGMLAQGDLALITAGSKSFKSWLALQIAICTASGIPFLDRKTTQTKTLVLNFELKPQSIRNRLRSIAHRLNCRQKNLTVWNLRNRTINAAFLAILTRTIKEKGFGLVILDPLYSMYGVVESDNVENSNPAMTELLSTIRATCEEVGAAVLIIHHHAKGDSAAKASIDRASGAGALGRFPDSVLSLIPHQLQNAYVVEIDFRDFPPCDPFVIRRENCIMVLDEDLDPASKKTTKPANTKMTAQEVLAFLPEEGKAIDRATLKDRIASTKFVAPRTADRHITAALQLKICSANRHGIYLPKKEVQTRF